jgi:hypothetical protein
LLSDFFLKSHYILDAFVQTHLLEGGVDEVNVVDEEDSLLLVAREVLGGVLLAELADGVLHLSESDHEHVLVGGVGNPVEAGDEVHVAESGVVGDCLAVELEVLGLCFVDVFHVELEYVCESGPQYHVHLIEVVVEHRDLVLLQDLLVHLIYLYHEQDCVYVKHRCIYVALKPVQVVIDYPGEHLVEEVGALSEFEVKELQDEHELFADGLDEQLVL